MKTLYIKAFKSKNNNDCVALVCKDQTTGFEKYVTFDIRLMSHISGLSPRELYMIPEGETVHICDYSGKEII